MSNTSKCAKDDYVAIEETHSSVSISFKRETYLTYSICRVESATREGIAKTLRRSPAQCSTQIRLDLDRSVRVLCLPHEMQAAALRVFVSHPADGFSDANELRTILRSEFAKAA